MSAGNFSTAKEDIAKRIIDKIESKEHPWRDVFYTEEQRKRYGLFGDAVTIYTFYATTEEGFNALTSFFNENH